MKIILKNLNKNEIKKLYGKRAKIIKVSCDEDEYLIGKEGILCPYFEDITFEMYYGRSLYLGKIPPISLKDDKGEIYNLFHNDEIELLEDKNDV